jgi:molybdopterin synthase sulfur carrier subunit
MSLSSALALGISGVGVGAALATSIRAYREYVQQGDQRRTELFFSLRARLKEDDLAWIAELIDLATEGKPEEIAEAEQELSDVSLRHKRDYVGLFEEVATFMGTGQIKREDAHYMFGYYALLCDECLAFWNNINYDSIYWKRFHDFCAEMRKMRNTLATSVEDPGLIKRGVYLPDNKDGEIIAVTVRIPTQLRAATGGENEVEVAGTTVGEAIESLFRVHPDLRERITQDGDLRRFVNVYVSGEDIRFQDGLDTPIEDGAEVTILPAVAGG